MHKEPEHEPIVVVQPERRFGRVARVGGIAGAVFLLANYLNPGFIGGIKGWVDGLTEGGESDPAPQGVVIYQGQTVETASGNFLIELGQGEALVSVKAKQNHDKKGGLFSGDFQSTNGTSHVRDPDNSGKPATLHVETRYCADGYVEKETITDNATREQSTNVTFHVGQISLCDAILRADDARNTASFKQDDTPNGFHGDFVAFVSKAVQVQAQAAPCPTEEIEKFMSPEFNAHARSALAKSMAIPEENVTVVNGSIGKSSDETKQQLKAQLDSFANKIDPDNPTKTYKSLDMQFLTGGKAVDESCFKDVGRLAFDTLEQFNPNQVLSTTDK